MSKGKIVDVGPQKCIFCDTMAKWDEPIGVGRGWGYVCDRHHGTVTTLATRITEYTAIDGTPVLTEVGSENG